MNQEGVRMTTKRYRVKLTAEEREELKVLTRISHNQVENDVFHGMRWVRAWNFASRVRKGFGGRECVCFPRLFAGGTAVAEYLSVGRPARSVASVMNPVALGFYVGAKLAQINRKSFQYGKADPNAR